MLTINETKLEFELFDADTLDAYEAAFAKVEERNAKAQKSERASQVLRESCDAIKECFDGIFGDGTGVKVCGQKPDFMKHMDAFEALVDEAVKQRAVLDDRMVQSKKRYGGRHVQQKAVKE